MTLRLPEQRQNVTNTLPLLFAPIDVLRDFDLQFEILVISFVVIQEEEKSEKEMMAQVIHHIHLWARFEELRHLLGAGLRDIESRWSMGKGPSAVLFATDEVKQLIRAFFKIATT